MPRGFAPELSEKRSSDRTKGPRIGAIVLVIAVCAVATLIPVLNAAQVEPWQVLREEEPPDIGAIQNGPLHRITQQE
jgi:hypothetical protein